MQAEHPGSRISRAKGLSSSRGVLESSRTDTSTKVAGDKKYSSACHDLRRSGKAAKMSPHSVNQRPVRSMSVLLESSSPREQASELRVQAAGWSTLQVPRAQSASKDLMDVRTAQTKTITMTTERISIMTESGCTQVGWRRIIFFRSVFLTSSLKLVSHF